MSKIDLKKQLKPLYQTTARAVVEVDVPPLTYLMIDGHGDPNTSPVFAAATEALYSVSYALKFKIKNGPLAIDYGVMPLQGLWWADDPAVFAAGDKALWHWTLMILQPSYVTAELVQAVVVDLTQRKRLPALAALRFESLHEGRCAQILHVGPFATEGATIARLHEHIAAQGALRGKHHEIYLSDFRKADPSRWKTLIRQPMTCGPPSPTPQRHKGG